MSNDILYSLHGLVPFPNFGSLPRKPELVKAGAGILTF